VARKGAREWLDARGALTTDEWAAATFDYQTTATIFLLESVDDIAPWHVELVAERCPVCLHVLA
jgi:hypothetical protein